MVKTLTDRGVAGARFADRTHNEFDQITRGLALRVGARKKVWYFTYRRNGGTPQWLKLGEYPALKLADARDRAEKERAVLADGRDPVAEVRKAAEPPPPPPAPPPVLTFSDFLPVYIAFQKGRKKTWFKDEALAKRYLVPAWGSLPLKDISREQISDLLDTVSARGLTVGVNRLQALISGVFSVALEKGKVAAHPAARMKKRATEEPRDRVLSDDELRALWAALAAQPGAASDAIKLRLLLGQRGEETIGMRWSEVDLEAAHWSLPRPRTKNKQPHVVGLPPTAFDILTRRREATPDDEPRVFPGLTLSGTEHRALGKLHGGRFTWKDLRRTLSTGIASLGFDDTTIDRVLNHKPKTVTGRHYNKFRYLEEIRGALVAWDREVARILANEPKSKTPVLPMRRRS